jgi:SAM-dependent methyltransferase
VDLHPLARQFASVAAQYDHGRPGYPPAVVAALAGELGLRPGDPVLDLGAGTGKLSRALLAAGFDLVAVEPLAPLREVLCGHVGAERVREGRAEQIPVADGAVAAVTVADAFHWFDRAAALVEIRRVLRPGGGLALVNTIPDWSGASWAHELGTLVAGSRPEHPHFDGPPWQDSVRADGGFGEPHEVRVTVAQPADPDRIADHMASMSWIAGLDDDQRRAFVDRVRAMIAAGDTPAEMPMHYELGIAHCRGRDNRMEKG